MACLQNLDNTNNHDIIEPVEVNRHLRFLAEGAAKRVISARERYPEGLAGYAAFVPERDSIASALGLAVLLAMGASEGRHGTPITSSGETLTEDGEPFDWKLGS